MKRSSARYPMFFRSISSFLGLFICLGSQGGLGAIQFHGVDFPESIRVAKKELLLNGVGLRTKQFILKFDVYAGGLYLQKKASTLEEALALPYPKEVRMHFLRTVSSETAGKTLEESFANNCSGPECEEAKQALGSLKAAMKEIQQGDRLAYTIFADRVELRHNDNLVGESKSTSLAKTMLSAWIGPNPANPELKQGLLGLPPS